MQNIAFVGFKSSGKNTAAEALLPFGYVPFSFADALKDSLATIFCWDRTLLEGITKESRLWREQVDHWWSDKLNIQDFTPRWAMQNFGTEVMRRHFHEEIWVYNVERRIALLWNKPFVLIDARFPNEINLSRKYGGKIIRIKRGADPVWMEDVSDQQKMKDLGIHESEYAWINCETDAMIENDGSIAMLKERTILEVGL